MKHFNKYSSRVTQDESQPAAQAMLHALGLDDSDFSKPFVDTTNSKIKAKNKTLVDIKKFKLAFHTTFKQNNTVIDIIITDFILN